MHSITNLLKFNAVNNEKLNFEKMSVEELKNHQKKFKSIKSNVKLINSLKDKGEKIDENLKIIEVGLKKFFLNYLKKLFSKEQIKKLENKKTNESSEVLEILVNKLDTLEFEKVKNSETEVEVEDKSNYFSKISTKPILKTEKNIDTQKLSEVKAKIKENINKQCKYKESKEIPVDEAFKLLKEHEKRIQEYQMKQAAERLLMGQSVKYEFSFLERTDKENLAYRDNDKDYDDEDYNDEDEVEDEQFFDKEFYSGSGIDKIHKSEKMKYKQYSDELEKVD